MNFKSSYRPTTKTTALLQTGKKRPDHQIYRAPTSGYFLRGNKKAFFVKTNLSTSGNTK